MIIKCLNLFFDHFLDSRAEILEIISLVFWKKLSFHKDIIKLTDLYLSLPLKNEYRIPQLLCLAHISSFVWHVTLVAQITVWSWISMWILSTKFNNFIGCWQFIIVCPRKIKQSLGQLSNPSLFPFLHAARQWFQRSCHQMILLG